MTNQEILEAQKLIVGMRAYLSRIAETTDVEKLLILLNEKGDELLIDSFAQLVRYQPPLFESESAPDYVTMRDALVSICGWAHATVKDSGKGSELVGVVEKSAPLVNAILDKIAQALKKQATTAAEVS
jgi:hypothetical protein